MTASEDRERFRVAHSVNRRWWHLAVNVLAASNLISPRLRRAIYRRCRMSVKSDTVLPGCFFYGNDVTIEEETWINHRCYFDTRAPIHIGRSCDVGMEVMFCSSSHEIGPASRRAGRYIAKPITVEDGCWIGSRAMLLPGVRVGAGCVVAAGAIVTSDCEPNSLYAGVPARRIRDLDRGIVNSPADEEPTNE